MTINESNKLTGIASFRRVKPLPVDVPEVEPGEVVIGAGKRPRSSLANLS